MEKKARDTIFSVILILIIVTLVGYDVFMVHIQKIKIQKQIEEQRHFGDQDHPGDDYPADKRGVGGHYGCSNKTTADPKTGIPRSKVRLENTGKNIRINTNCSLNHATEKSRTRLRKVVFCDKPG